MIILATVAINALFGSNGLITRAQQAKEMAEIAQVQEQLELAKMEAYLDGNGKITADSYFEQLEEAGIIVDKEKDVVDNGDGTYEVTTEGGEIFEVTITEDGNIEIEYVGKGENIGPRIREIKITNKTTNSVTIEVDARNAEDADYTYSYKKVGEEEWKEVETSKSNTCTIENLEAQASYTIKVKVETKNGVAEKETSTTIGELPEGTITFGQVEWVGDGTASVVINTSEEGYQLQYQKNGIEGQWTTIGSGEKITGLVHNDTVYGRLFDGTNGTKDEASVSIKDEVDPVVTVSPGGTTTNSITVSVSAIDNESGMKDNPTYNYYIKKISEDDSSYALKGNTLTETSYTFTGLTQETSYDVKVEVTGDKAGRTGAGVLGNQVTTKVGGADGGLVTGNILASSPTWSGGTASITLTTDTGMQIQYQVNGITEGSWTTASTGVTVSGLHHNDTVYARLFDGVNAGDYGSVSIIDNTPPSVDISTSNLTYNSVTLNVTASDSESGLATSGTYTYYLDNEQKASNTTNSYTYMDLTGGISYTLKVVVKDNAGKTTEKSTTITTEKEIILENTSYVGYYADVDGNGSVDGVIYADLAIGGSGIWNLVENSTYDRTGTYTIPKGSNFKKYEISKKNYTDDFGTKDVIKLSNTSGNERFYIMALEDVDSSYHHWYNAATGNMSDYTTATSTSFGRGKQNTIKMIAKWNSSSYGEQNSGSHADVWGLSTVQSKINTDPAWYVPSREEWAAFGGELGITKTNYANKGLMRDYWSSSQGTTSFVWGIQLRSGYIYYSDVVNSMYVRLGTTF